MLKLVLDPSRLAAILQDRGWSYNDLAEQITITYRPTPRVVEEWRRGNVSARWRLSLIEKLKIGEETIADPKRAAIALRAVKKDRLKKIEVIERGITRAAISEWLEGGGIDIERLVALCKVVNAKPHEILSDQTRELLGTLANGGEKPVADLMF